MELEKKIEKQLYLIISVVSFLMLAMVAKLCFSEYIWGDEAFTLQMIKHSYFEMLILTAKDVHPPLYYVILKFVYSIMGGLLRADVIGRLFSLTFTLLTIVFLIVHRDEFFLNRKMGIALILSIILMPSIIKYSLEIRMYSMGMFLFTVSFYYFLKVVRDETATNKNYFLLTLWGTLGAYVHYFVGLMVTILFLYLLTKSIMRGNGCKKCLLFAFIGGVMYAPWAVLFLRQLITVKHGYWISQLSIDGVIELFQFIMGNHFYVIMVVLIIISCAYMFESNIASKDGNKEMQPEICLGAWLFAVVIFLSYAISKLYRPILVPRYLLPCLAVFWLCFWIMLEKTSMNGYIKMIIVITVIVLGMNNSIDFYLEYNTKNRAMAETLSEIEKIEGGKIVTTNGHITDIIISLMDIDVYLTKENDADIIHAVFGDNYIYEESIKELVNEDLYYVGIIEDMTYLAEQYGITWQEVYSGEIQGDKVVIARVSG